MTRTAERARHAALRRHRVADDPAVVESRQKLKALQAEDYIRRIVDEAPPLSPDQRNALAAILTRTAE